MNNLSAYKNLSDDFKQSETYTYFVVRDRDLSNIDLHSITLKNCIIQNTDFTKTILANSDIDSSQIERCIFNEQSFQNSDIISCNFINCKFNNVNFKGCTMKNNTFENCVFYSCNFNHITMTDSFFTTCKIEKMNLRQSSTSLNTFKNCKLISSKIYGNFVFNLFIDCTYEKSVLDISLFASNFLPNQNYLAELEIYNDNIMKLQQDLLDEKDFISAAIVELNTNKDKLEYSLVFCVSVILNQIENNIIVRTEEIQFIEIILEYFLNNNLIAPITIVHLLCVVDEFKRKNFDNTALDKAESNINHIENTLFIAFRNYIEKLDRMISKNEIKGTNVTIKFTFKEKPSVETCEILSLLQKKLGINSPQPIQIKTEVGSFIEWIESPDNIVKCLQLFTSIIGLFVKIKPSHKKNKETVDKEKTNKDDIVLKTDENTMVLNLPNTIKKQIGQIQTEKDVSTTINVFLINDMTIKNDYRGFNKYNIESVECFYK